MSKRLVDLGEMIPYFMETVQGTETVFMKDDLEACPEVKQNQTYEDWLEETIICIKADYTSMSSITKALKQQANFIWQKLCEKDDKIIELERKIDEAKRIIQHMTLPAEIMKGETDE